jgi:hypothetical protein
MGDIEDAILYEEDEELYSPEQAICNSVLISRADKFALTPFKSKFCKGLQLALASFSNALKFPLHCSAPEPKTSPRTSFQTNIFPEEVPETLIDGIRLAYNMLKSKLKDAKDETYISSPIQDLLDCILKGSYELINLI